MKLLACLLLLLCASLVYADPASDARQAIEALYAQADTAAMSGDWAIYERICIPDCRFVQPGQPAQTVPQLEAVMKQVLPQWQGLKNHTAVDTIAVTGSTAIVTNTQTTDGAFNGQPLHDVTQNKDTWTLTPAGWRMSRSEVVSDKMTPGVPLPTDPKLDAAVVSQVKADAVPLTTVEAGHDNADLAAFGKAVGDAPVVALGEASHGTREFFQMKHRLLEYLVTQKGFTVFALEANWPETAAVDRYIKTGQGDPKAALAGLYFWTWNTEEVLDMIEWMRAYNAVPGVHPTLSFSGFDMQTPGVAMTNVTSYLHHVYPADATTAAASYASLRRLMAAQKQARKAATPLAAPPSPAIAAHCLKDTEAVVQLFDAHQAECVKASSASAFQDARQNAVIVQQAARKMTLSFQDGSAYRDRAMADNVRWLTTQKYPGQKIVLWAHDGHVGAFTAGHRSMGSYLRETYGSKLYALGFAFDSGEIRAVKMTGGRMSGRAVPLPVSPAPAGTGDAVLHATALPLFFLDFHAVPPGSVLGGWLASPHPFRMPGAAWDPAEAAMFAQPVVLRTAYDGLIYVDVSHASRELPFPKRTASRP